MVLDASALLALLNGEVGADRVAEAVVEGALVSAVNLSEVVAKLTDYEMDESVVRDALEGLDLSVVPFDEQQAYDAGTLRSVTRTRGLSLGDRACLALARRRGVPALTADRQWADLVPGVSVALLR